MNGRELGQMRIENDAVIFRERLLDPDERQILFTNLPVNIYGLTSDMEILTEWSAVIEDRTVAYGMLHPTETKGIVRGFVIVNPDQRGLGIGKFMARFITDLAIRNRQRAILIRVGNDVARAIADQQEFEPIPDQQMGEMQKILKWI